MKKLGLVTKLILIAIISVFITAVALVTVSAIRIDQTYESLILEELKATAEHLDSQFENAYEGDWSLVDGEMYKGEHNVMGPFGEEMDTLHAETGIDYTLFYGDTRIITTIMKKDGSGRLVGTKDSDKVIATTLNGGQEMGASDLNIEGNRYMGYYCPLHNSNGAVVGMCFTGRHSEDVAARIRHIVLSLVIIAVVILAVVIAIGVYLNKSISGQMQDVSEGLLSLAEGHLDAEIDNSIMERTDELGTIGHGTKGLLDKISDIIGRSKDISNKLTSSGTELASSSSNASSASEQVASAVDDIAKGAISQAESIQNAATETSTIGNDIEMISDSVQVLNGASDRMKDNCDETKRALDTLIAQAEKVSESVTTIATTIDRTNQSAKDISEFTEAINSIATQTNLLSLNASIEAARAGEAGKGFAVVAGEISSLAAQSKESADKINSIVGELIHEAEESVQVMKILTENFGEQGKQLDATKASMDEMEAGIGDVMASAKEIDEKVSELNSAKDMLNGIIEDLSAISEENAASTQETNASMQELSATFSVINDNAEELKTLAADLSETIGYFN